MEKLLNNIPQEIPPGRKLQGKLGTKCFFSEINHNSIIIITTIFEIKVTMRYPFNLVQFPIPYYPGENVIGEIDI